jgi:hypothetical protein
MSMNLSQLRCFHAVATTSGFTTGAAQLNISQPSISVQVKRLESAYGVELFIAWYGGNAYERFAFINRALGPYAWGYWTMIVCNVLVPQLFWLKRCRTTPWIMFIIAVLVNVGMWTERFVIVVVSLSRDFLPSSWGQFVPTKIDILMLLGSFGLFFTLFLLFCRYLPVVAMAEVKQVMADQIEETHE